MCAKEHVLTPLATIYGSNVISCSIACEKADLLKLKAYANNQVVKLADADTGTKMNNEPAPSDNLYVKGLPLSITTVQIMQILWMFLLTSTAYVNPRPFLGTRAYLGVADIGTKLTDALHV